MTAVFWVYLVVAVALSVLPVVLYRRIRELRARNRDLLHYLTQSMDSRRMIKADADRKAAEYRAAYRDLIGDFTKLHTKYKAMGGKDD